MPCLLCPPADTPSGPPVCITSFLPLCLLTHALPCPACLPRLRLSLSVSLSLSLSFSFYVCTHHPPTQTQTHAPRPPRAHTLQAGRRRTLAGCRCARLTPAGRARDTRVCAQPSPRAYLLDSRPSPLIVHPPIPPRHHRRSTIHGCIQWRVFTLSPARVYLHTSVLVPVTAPPASTREQPAATAPDPQRGRLCVSFESHKRAHKHASTRRHAAARAGGQCARL